MNSLPTMSIRASKISTRRTNNTRGLGHYSHARASFSFGSQFLGRLGECPGKRSMDVLQAKTSPVEQYRAQRSQTGPGRWIRHRQRK
jgi:hypothetical protein